MAVILRFRLPCLKHGEDMHVRPELDRRDRRPGGAVCDDGRDWPEDMYDNPMFRGYSIGKWVDTDGDGKFDMLEVETRGIKNPRTYDPTGIPFHDDGRTIVKERFYLDKSNPNLLHLELTT